MDTKWDGVSQGAVSPYVVHNIQSAHRIIFIYSPNAYPVSVTYEKRDGTQLSGPNQDATVNHGTIFRPTVPAMTDMCLVDWKLNGVSQNNTNPKVTVTQYANIVLVYGQDKNHDGREDVTITEDCYCVSGTHLGGSYKVYVNIGDTYNAHPRSFAGHAYSAHQINGGNVIAGTAQITNVRAAANVSLLYSHNDYTVSVKHVDTGGSAIGGGNDYTQTVAYQASWSGSAGSIQGYTYQGYKIGNGALQSGNPSIASVTDNTTVSLVYAANSSPNPNPNPPDHGNYNFVKTPNVKNVAAGETVSYTFANFGNEWGIPLERYSITDRPDRGLDFQWAHMPAFTNGSGITYDIVYYTSSGAEVVYYTGIPADAPFSFSAPILSGGEYITSITFEFGTVPAGFGTGDTFDIGFRVWDNPPSQTLTNVGMLGYKIGNEYKEFSTGNSGMVTIGGWFSGLAKMGDTSVVVWLAVIAGLSILAISFARRRRRSNR